MLILLALTLLAWWSAVAVARRLYPEGGAERALASLLIALGQILGTIHVLGWTGHLTRPLLGVGVCAVALATAAIALRKDLVGGARDTTRAALAQLVLPVAALRRAWRERSAIGIGVGTAFFVVVWTTWLSWLASSGAWDGLWYHEPLVGFALQNQGFSLVEVSDHHHWVNGYPRTSENLMLWLVAFGDRRLIDASQQLIVPLGFLSTYVMVRRVNGNWRTGAAGIASVLLTVPAVVLQFRSTHTDVTVMSTFLCALAFLTRPKFRVAELWLSGLALGLLGGTKSSMLFYACVLGLVGIVRMIVLTRRRGAWVPLHFVVALALTAGLMAPTYVRNWQLHENPIWPIHYEAAGLVFEGPAQLQDMHIPLEQQIHELWGAPTPGQDYHDTQKHAYGYGLSFLGIPFLALALLILPFDLFVRRRRRQALQVIGVLALGGLTLALTPAFQSGRFALAGIAVVLCTIGWVVHRLRARRLGEGLIFAMLSLNLITLWWAEPAWDVDWDRVQHLTRLHPNERVSVRVSHCQPEPETVRWRQANVQTGDVFAFSDRVTFVGNLWNERMTNRVVYVPFRDRADRRSFLERLDALEADAVATEEGGAAYNALHRAEGWREVGPGPFSERYFERRAR